jgi:hypothetical protein
MRGVIKFLLTFVIGIALIWLGFWWYAESRLQSGFTAWADQQATRGWKISYDSIHRGSSIFDAAVTINNLSLTLPPDTTGGQISIGLPSLSLRIHALNQLVFHTDLPNRITINLGHNLGLVWSTASSALAENLDPNQLFNRSADPFWGGDFSASDVDLLASGSLLMLHIDKISGHSDLNLKAGADHTALASKIAFDGIAYIPFDGKLAHIDAALRLSGPVPANLPQLLGPMSALAHNLAAQQRLIMPVAHQWAASGGSGNAAVNSTIGPSTIKAGVALKFDSNLQPDGTADLTADHLDQLTAAITNANPRLQADVAQAAAQASQFLSNTDQGGQTLAMHVVFGPPGIFINGQKTGDLPPFDWNAALNPLPAPVQATGDGSGAAGPAAPPVNPDTP